MLLGNDCLLCCVGTANRGTVLLPALLLGPGTAALDVCDLLGVLFVGGALDVTVVRTGCAHHPLVFHRGDDVVEPSVSVLGCDSCVPELESSCCDDGTDLEDFLGLLVFEVDCALHTGFLTLLTALALSDHKAVVCIDQCNPGNCLGVGDVDCSPVNKSVLELVGDLCLVSSENTGVNTVSASSTGSHVDVPGLLLDSDLEVSGLSVNLYDLRIGQYGDIGVTCTICHFGREDTCRTVIRRESLVETAHLSTDGGVFLHQVDVDVPVGKIQRSLDTCDSSTDNQR